MAMSDYSLADLATASGGRDSFGGNGIWLLVILFFLLGFGGNGFGNRASDFSQYATSASQQEILFGQQFQNLNSAINKVGDGLCSSTYALNNAIQSEGRNLQSQVEGVRFDMANYSAGIQAAIHAEGEQTRNLLQQNKIESLQGQINQLQLQSAMCGVIRYPTATTYTASNPYFGCGCYGTAF